MTHRLLRFLRGGRLLRGAASAALACAAAAVLVAQSAAQSTSPSQSITSPSDSRTVTAVGCLKQEKDIPGRLAALTDRHRSGEAFVLVDTRITSAAPTDSTASDAAAAAGSAAAAERARTTAPSGSPGVSGSGTSSTGSTSEQSSDRPSSDAAKTAQSAARAGGGETMYKVTGLPEAQLRPHLNKQVEIRATLNVLAMGGAAVRQPGTTMGHEPAGTPSASSPPPAPTQAPSAQSDRRDERPSDVPDLPELRALSIRAIGGTCQGT